MAGQQTRLDFSAAGIEPEVEEVYRALVGLPRATAAQVAKVCGISPGSAGRRLAQMVNDGLATRVSSQPARFSAAPPDVAVIELILQRESALNQARAEAHRLAQEHYAAVKIIQPELAVDLLVGRDEITSAVQRLTIGARREVRAFDRPPYVDRPGSNLELQLGRQRHGVVHRVVYDREAVASPGRLEGDILPSIRAGERARTGAAVPMKLIISDDRAAIIPFSLAPGGQTAAYHVRSSPILTALGLLFEAVWETATPLLPPKSASSGDAGLVAPDVQQLLSLLASGLTDSAIARAQGWSERTTQRRIQRLMSTLGATTRFQAAALAARRGWL
jgi:DNA-binding CsgD family transcriptional regulator